MYYRVMLKSLFCNTLVAVSKPLLYFYLSLNRYLFILRNAISQMGSKGRPFHFLFSFLTLYGHLQVWVMFQDNIIHYLSNSLLLPLVIRSNRTISKYFLGYDSTISCLSFDGSDGVGTLGKVISIKHVNIHCTPLFTIDIYIEQIILNSNRQNMHLGS